VLSTDDFATFAGEYVMFAHVTTRIEGREHDGLLSERGFGGFPSLAAMDAEGGLIARLSGDRDVSGFRGMMADAERLLEIRARTDRSLEDEVWLLEREIELGTLDAASARARAEALEGLDEAQRASIEGRLTDLEIKEALGKPTSQEEYDELARKASVTFAAMWAAGREPTSDEAYQPFFILILDHAEAQRDAELFERALARLRERFGDSSRTAAFFKAADERLAALRAGASVRPEDEDSRDDGSGADGADGEAGEGDGNDGDDGG
jgi:hypothetical protein